MPLITQSSINQKSVHPPLTRPNSTRVLRLAAKSESGDGHLHGELLKIDLDNPPDYEAISYVWGNRINAGKILCNFPVSDEKEVI